MIDDRKPLKVGVRKGGGPPPGYEWSVVILDLAHRESLSILNPAQRRHLTQQVKELARQEEVSLSETVDVRRIDDALFEIRDYGGILGGLNIRLFYGVEHEHRNLIVLGVFKKQNNGPTPAGDMSRMRVRWRRYKHGEFGTSK